MFTFKFINKDNNYLIDVWIQCTSLNIHVHYEISNLFKKDTMPSCIKAVVLHHVGIHWLILTKEIINFMLMKHVHAVVKIEHGTIQ